MKTELASIAAQWASAIFELAVENGSEKAVLDNLKSINALIANSKQLESVLRHPSVPASEKKELLNELLQGKINILSRHLLGLLCDRRRLPLLPHIESQYVCLWNDKQNIAVGTLTFAEKADTRVLSEIKSALAQKLGKTLELEEKEDKSLIGGYVLRIGDQVIDGSLKGRLQTIEKSLLSV